MNKSLTDKPPAADASRSKSEFVVGITKELRSSVVDMMAMSNVLSGARLTVEERETTTLLSESTQRLLRVINNLHDLSQLEAGLMRMAVGPVDLRLATEDVLESFAPQADSKRLDLSLHYDPELPKRIITDSGRYRQLLSLFVHNAIDFTSKGQVTIRVSAEAITKNGIVLLIHIQDTGIGIEAVKLESLFEGSAYNDPSSGSGLHRQAREGTGLGLLLARRLLEAMNGDVLAESQPGVGTSISLRLKMPRDPNEWPRASPLPAARGKRILVADPTSTIRSGLVGILATYGIETSEASDGRTALKLLKSAAAEGSKIWAVLFSAELSGLDWQAFGAAVRQIAGLEDTELILLTRFANEPEASVLARTGFHYALRRNPTSSQIRRVLQQLITDRSAPAHTHASPSTNYHAPTGGFVNTYATKNVLLVSPPNEAEIDKMTAVLDSIGCIYSVAHDTEIAFSRDYDSSFDLILLDQALCQAHSGQTMDWIKASHRKREGIVVLVDKLDSSATHFSAELGIGGILEKPVSASDLQALLQLVSRERDGKRLTFDRKAVLERCGNELLLFAELIGDFRAGGSKLLEKLVNAMGARDSVTVLARIQELKAAARFISAERLCECLDDISELVALQDWAALPGRLSSLKIELGRLMSDLAGIDDNAIRAESTQSIPVPESRGTILKVGDDYMSRRFVERVLGRAGYTVVGAASAAEAQNEVRRLGVSNYACLIADFDSSATGGMGLLTWMREQDGCISTIATSGSADKTLVEQTLRAGVCNFLNKPLDRGTLERAVSDAVEITRKGRRALEMKRDVEQVGAIQRTLITASAGGKSGVVTLCLHPKHEAGGDFLSHFQLAGSRSLVMLTDVSGHDLKSAFVSAYFHGMVRAMLESGMSLSAVFDRGNHFLLNESNSEEGSIPISIAACSVIINEAAGDIEVLTSGSPSPILTTDLGECIRLRGGTSFPLGWFADKQADLATLPLVPGQITLWTDGVEELADQLGVSPPSVAFMLISAQQSCAEVPGLSKANDDILVATLRVQPSGHELGSVEVCYWPILEERYQPTDLNVIDDLQRYWEGSLSLAVPSLPAELHYDVLLCAREALINALKYGCAAGGEATLQLTFAPANKTVTLVIEDEGPGHDFDSEDHHAAQLDFLTPFHRGLFLMKALSSRFGSERNGARLIMDFTFERE